MPAAGQTTDRASRQLNTGDREKDDNAEGTQGFEFSVAVGVLFIGRAGCDAHYDETQDIVDSVHGGVDRVPDDGE